MTLDDKYLEIADMFANTLGEHLVPPVHVLNRAAALIGAESVSLVTGDFDGVDQITGHALIFSETRVVLIAMGESRREPHHMGSAESSVDVTAWPRRALREAGIQSDGDSSHNTDIAWQERGQHGWPSSARLELRYAGREQPIRLPMSPYPSTAERTQLAHHLPSILADLTPAAE